MSPKSTALEISVICAFFILLALWGAVYDITSGLLTSGIDGIMLLIVCLMMAGIFFLIMLVQLNASGILPTPAFLRPAPKPAAAAKPPAAAPAAPKPPAASAPAAPAGSAAPAAAAKPIAPVPAAASAKPPAPAPSAAPPVAPPTAPPTVPPTMPPTKKDE